MAVWYKPKIQAIAVEIQPENIPELNSFGCVAAFDSSTNTLLAVDVPGGTIYGDRGDFLMRTDTGDVVVSSKEYIAELFEPVPG